MVPYEEEGPEEDEPGPLYSLPPPPKSFSFGGLGWGYGIGWYVGWQR